MLRRPPWSALTAPVRPFPTLCRSSYADRLVEDWRDCEVRNVHDEMMRGTMQIVSKTLFDADVEKDVDELGRAFEIVLREVAARFRRPFKIPDAVPTPGNRSEEHTSELQ